MRLFISVDLDDLADAVAAVQEPLRDCAGLNCTDPAQAHLTLKFLGEVDPDDREAVEAAVAAAVDDAAVEPFEAAFGGLGVFPSLDYISVVWLGVRDGRGDRELTRLHEALESRTTAIGFEAERHEFTPHVTLARMEHAAEKERVQRYVTENDPDAGTLPVREVRLTESTPTDDGPVYETVSSFPLEKLGAAD